MESPSINDLMVPIKEYASVSGEATVLEAVEALEAARQKLIKRRFKHRSVLVVDDQAGIIGKIRHLDVINHLEPGYDRVELPDYGQRKHLTLEEVDAIREKNGLWQRPLAELCRDLGAVPVRRIMHRFTATEYVDLATPIEKAIHQMVTGRHLSVLVTDQGDVVGVLRLTDVYSELCQTMKYMVTKV